MPEQDEDVRRRKYPRVKESCNVKYHVVQGPAEQLKEQGAAAVNIGGGGMCFSADQQIEPGAMIAMEMTLSELPTPVVSLGRVVWCEQTEGPDQFDVGVEFWWVGWADQEAQAQMLKYIKQKVDELGISGDTETE